MSSSSCSSSESSASSSESNKNGSAEFFIGPGQSSRLNFRARDDLQHAKRIIVKIGSAVLSRDDQDGIALGRMASIVEQVAELRNQGKDVIVVTSGAVALGKQKIRTEIMMSQSMRQTLSQKNLRNENPALLNQMPCVRAAAAVGQTCLMSLYDTMFTQYGIIPAQILLTKNDLSNPISRKNISYTFDDLLKLNIVPIVNGNDAVVPPSMKDDPEIKEADSVPEQQPIMVHDNDSLAALLAVEVKADLLIILSNVDGVYNLPPNQQGSKLLSTFCPDRESGLKFGSKSLVGTGGMESKVAAALWALQRKVAVVICSGSNPQSITRILKGSDVGTFFTNKMTENSTILTQVAKVRGAGLKLQSLAPEKRSEILLELVKLLKEREKEIIKANELDLKQAEASDLSKSLMGRLKLTPAKLNDLCKGLQSIAEKSQGILGRSLRKIKISEQLILEQVTVPIGNILVIFESRPDCLPQIAGLCIATGNGIIAKGGKEALNSNRCIFNLIRQALSKHDVSDAICLVSSREEVNQLIQSRANIDLIIPRGSYELVKNIQERSGGIPVLGHSEGICHVYIDKDADLSKVLDIVIDSKCDYPSACNAAETILLHSSLANSEFLTKICEALKSKGVKLFSGPKLASSLTFAPPLTDSLRKEYGDLGCTMELVDSLTEAIQHINTYGSGHTDVIVTNNDDSAKTFLQNVDSACCFHNCSSRFADGYRFGLGAEVGISTGKIHARGPVGMEGLLSSKYILKGDGHTVEQFAKGLKEYKHLTINGTQHET